jgi:protein TonB
VETLGRSQTFAVPNILGRPFVIFLLCSLMAHAFALAILNKRMRSAETPRLPKPLDLVVVEVAPAPPKEDPVKPTVRLAQPPPVEPPPQRTRRRMRRQDPPPPNEVAPQPVEQPPLVVGLSLSSTATAGAVALPTGNTLYGAPSSTAENPANVKAYSAPRYTPFAQVDGRPEILVEVPIPYPEEAKRAAIEGDVVLSIDIDETGGVTAAKVLRGPGYGLNEAARDAILKWKFKPASKNGTPTATTVPFTYHFILN